MAKTQSIKVIVLVLFLVMTIVSIILMGNVKINYNISDYLDESTETKISLNIIESDFGSTGNIQVMVEDVSVEQAHEISKIINNIDSITFYTIISHCSYTTTFSKQKNSL